MVTNDKKLSALSDYWYGICLKFYTVEMYLSTLHLLNLFPEWNQNHGMHE